MFELAKNPTKNLWHSKCFILSIQSYSSNLLSRRKSAFLRKQIESLLDSLGEFLKAFDQANKVSQIPILKPKFEIGFTKAKDELFSHCYKDIVEHLNGQIRLSFRFEKNKTCVFSIKKFEHNGDQIILTEVVNLDDREIKHLYKNRILLLTSVSFLRAFTMCSSFSLDCGYDNSTIILIRDVFCPNSNCSGKLCRHKKTFQSLGRSDYRCPQCASVCQVLNIPFEDQTNSFFLLLGQGVNIFEESPKSIQDVIKDVYDPGTHCFNGEKCESLDGYLTTRRSIYGCGKSGAWLFVHEVSFMLQEHLKTTKTDKTHFFSAKKR